MADLKHWGYLPPNICKKGRFTWHLDGQQDFEILVRSGFEDGRLTIVLEYINGYQNVTDKIFLESLPSNLGGSYVWFMLCPVTGIRCRKLHLYSNRFMHRTAIPNSYYEQQVVSGQARLIISKIVRGFRMNILKTK